MKSILIPLVTLCLLSCAQKEEKHEFHGKWKGKFKSGPLAEARFREDGTHDYFMDGKLFSSGKSSFKNDTLRTFDPICDSGDEEYYATYKIDFINRDSIVFRAIEDTCKPRIYDMDGTGFSRLKP
ncbi:hypothetical protein [Leadbetterella sp. DM7]|uniref:hypothetical protein n=1 Tax=Leadbetterella sp. DM7 TaxID=3235085 RepID=UPI00349E8A76